MAIPWGRCGDLSRAGLSGWTQAWKQALCNHCRKGGGISVKSELLEDWAEPGPALCVWRQGSPTVLLKENPI